MDPDLGSCPHDASSPLLPMKPLLAPLAVLSPIALGALLRELSLTATNSTLTASAGQVAPQELAHALASADRLLAGGIVLSIAFCLVWLGRSSGHGRLQMACSGLLLAGLLAAAGGNHQLQALNGSLASDFERTIDQTLGTDGAIALYRSDYRADHPAHGSTQLEALLGAEDGRFQRASGLRWLGLGVALLAGLLASGASRRRRDEPATPAATA